MPDLAKLPKAIRVRGGAVSSLGEAKGHKFWLHHDDLAASAMALMGRNFVADHSRSIEKVAGVVTEVAVQRMAVDIPYSAEMAKKKQKAMRRDKGTRVKYQAELNSTFPAYETAASYIIALLEKGQVPNNSVAITGTSLEFDEETERFVLRGQPFTFAHIGLVDIGALGPDVGVGVEEYERFQCEFTMDFDGKPSVTKAITSHVVVENLDALCADFAAKHGLDSPLVERLGKALGRDGVDDATGGEKLAEEPAAAPPASERSYTPPLGDENNPTTKGGPMGDNDKKDLAGAPAAPAAPAAAPVVTKPVDDEQAKRLAALESQFESYKDLDARIKRFEEQEKTARDSALASKRGELKEKFSLKDEDLAEFTTAQQLDRLGLMLAARGSSPLPFEMFGDKPNAPKDPQVEKHKAARKWHDAKLAAVMGNTIDVAGGES